VRARARVCVTYVYMSQGWVTYMHNAFRYN